MSSDTNAELISELYLAFFGNCVGNAVGVVADIIALVVTWTKTFQQWRSAHRVNMHLPITACLLRDGAVYFLLLLTINVTNIATILPSWTLPFSGFIEFIPPILVSRFLLNLRSSTEPGITDPSIPRLSELSVQFATPNVSNVIGNIGAPLDYTQAEELIRAEYEFPGDESDASLSDTASATIGA
ncbi:uncharacterized protein PHACADRAFT_214061 [Phanerochaete carnosa HHB-10118-sp]|uniref:Uncharacterized protein n=1 Tax=Phanerochaete carnosa (strain HHB-10118-sp) TaxID=650164 RepID=K5UIX5_PHACS|nr:uncharacterized protein PHACADRAFT_214061 [Phanerochaete carnosa HHB-10118-sp]EKM49496.1 hypothetical protein PHACADRAFT_214061 [Phanerochaete carnosa HHB-10118-sp]